MDSQNRHMAPNKKYFVTREPKKNTKVLLLLKDDAKPYLTPAVRAALMEEVGKQYAKAKREDQIARKPKLTIAQAAAQQAEGKMTLEELTQGIKEGWITL